MIINKISLLKSGLYEVQIDKEKFKLSDETLIKYGIFKPGEYNISLKDLTNYNDFQMGYILAIKYMSNHLRTEKEIFEKLKKENIQSQSIKKIIERLKKENYLNDLNYVKSFINDQILLTNHGPKKIKNELLKKGISQENIDNILNDVEDSVWDKKIEKIISKKLKNYSGSRLMLIFKLKKEIINVGFYESNLSFIDNIDYNEEDSFQKDYNKYKKVLSKKYSDKKLEVELAKKIYSLGYRK